MFARGKFAIGICLLILLATSAPSGYAANDEKDNDAVVAALDRTLPIKFDNISIADAIQFIRETTGQNIVVNWKTLKDAGVDKDKTLITLDLRNVKFSKILKMILEQAAAGKLEYAIDGGIIEISTPEAVKAATTLPSHVAATQPSALDKKTQAILDGRLPGLNFNNIALADAFQFLRETTGANIVVDWTELKSVEIEGKTTVSANLRNVKLSKILDIVLDSAGNGKLDYKVEDNVIFILTAADAGRVDEPIFVAVQHPNKADEAVQAALDRTLPSIKFDNIALPDAFQFLRETTGQNIVVNWKTLEAAGIDKVTIQVSLDLRKAKFSTVLKTILNQAGGGKLAYTVDDGIIIISTREELKKTLPDERSAK